MTQTDSAIVGSKAHRFFFFLVSATLICMSSGCAEGMFWKAGKYSPWARQHWAEEEEIANTLFARKKIMTDAAQSVVGAPVELQQEVAQQLSEVLYRDPVLLLRLHSVKLLGELKCPAAIEALTNAARDHNSDIRVAAIKAWEKMPRNQAIPQLQELVGSDSDIDVRLAATRALGSFSGQQAVAALGMALQDSDPALQLRAAESLAKVTGESYGRDVQAWQQYVSNFSIGTASPDSSDYPEPTGTARLAEDFPNTSIR